MIFTFVLGFALVVLLPVRHAGLRVRGHDDPGLRSVLAGFERALCRTGFPSSYSVVSSPRYQMLPSASCAYQSSVTSTGTPSSVTSSCTTRAVDTVGDLLGLVRHRYPTLVGALAVRLAVDPLAPDGHRPPRVVDLRREVGGVELTVSLPCGRSDVAAAVAALVSGSFDVAQAAAASATIAIIAMRFMRPPFVVRSAAYGCVGVSLVNGR